MGRLGTVQVCTWRRLGTVQVWEEIRGFYNCLEGIRFCTSVWRRLDSVPVCGGDWVLYMCVGGYLVSKTSKTWFCTSV